MGFIEHKESGAPLGVCKVGLGQSLLEKGTTYLFIFFTSLPQTPEEPRGPSDSI